MKGIVLRFSGRIRLSPTVTSAASRLRPPRRPRPHSGSRCSRRGGTRETKGRLSWPLAPPLPPPPPATTTTAGRGGGGASGGSSRAAAAVAATAAPAVAAGPLSQEARATESVESELRDRERAGRPPEEEEEEAGEEGRGQGGAGDQGVVVVVVEEGAASAAAASAAASGGSKRCCCCGGGGSGPKHSSSAVTLSLACRLSACRTSASAALAGSPRSARRCCRASSTALADGSTSQSPSQATSRNSSSSVNRVRDDVGRRGERPAEAPPVGGEPLESVRRRKVADRARDAEAGIQKALGADALRRRPRCDPSPTAGRACGRP